MKMRDKDMKNNDTKGINKSILNTFAVCGDWEKCAILFDLMLATDNTENLKIPDIERLKILCDYYKVKFYNEDLLGLIAERLKEFRNSNRVFDDEFIKRT